jgi:hypothetical protein
LKCLTSVFTIGLIFAILSKLTPLLHVSVSVADVLLLDRDPAAELPLLAL